MSYISVNTANIFQWFKVTLAINVILLLISISDVYAKPHLTIVTPNFPPYTLKNDSQISGIGIDLANKVFKQAGINVHYRMFPNYAKALYEIEQGRGDAILLASRNDERDNIAVFTKPLMINRWCWYLINDAKLTPYDKDFKTEAKISSPFKSNTHKWLIANDYAVEPTMQVDKLPQMLIKNRVDAVFIAELVFEEAIKQSNLELSQFTKYIEAKKPFGIYISKAYLAKHPKVLTKVNQAIEQVNLDDSL